MCSFNRRDVINRANGRRGNAEARTGIRYKFEYKLWKNYSVGNVTE